MKRIYAWLLILSFILLCGCSNTNTEQDHNGSTADSADVTFKTDNDSQFTDRDLSGTYEDGIPILLKGDSATCSDSSVKISGTTVTITAEGTYLLSGNLTDGSVIVDAEKAKVQLVLNGVNIYCEAGAPICILNAKKVFLTLAENTENRLECGETLEPIREYTINAAIYSRSNLTVNGSGTLDVISGGSHGISSKDDLRITGGTLNITCAKRGLDANDSIRICGGTVTIASGTDGIHAENNDDAQLGYLYMSGGTLNITSNGDGISAASTLQIEDGTINITAGGGYANGKSHNSNMGGGFDMGGGHGMGGGRPGRSSSSDTSSTSSSSTKGIKAGTDMLISDGNITVDSADDSIHANGSITVNGGNFTLSSGDDGIHADDDLTITDCNMTINESYEGLEAAILNISGGTFVINASDDGLNAADGTSTGMGGGFSGMGGGFGMGETNSGNADAQINISGGKLSIYAGGDCLDSNGTLTISGGYVYATNPTSGDTSVLDADGNAYINGGTYIGLGITTNMAETFSGQSQQGVIACTVGQQSAGTQITVSDNKGNILIDVTTEYSTVLMIVSSPDIVKGESYTVTVGTTSGEITAS